MSRKVFSYLLSSMLLISLLTACASEPKADDPASKNITDPLVALQKAVEKEKAQKGYVNKEHRHVEYKFQTDVPNSGFAVTLKKIRDWKNKVSKTFEPYTEYASVDYESNVTNVSIDEENDPPTKTHFEEYTVNNMLYTKSDEGWTKMKVNPSKSSFINDFLEQIIQNKSKQGIKMIKKNNQYHISIDKKFFDSNKQVFDYYKKNVPYSKPTDSFQKQLKKDTGCSILFDQAEFKSPTLQVAVDANNFMIKHFVINNSLRIPVKSDKKTDDGEEIKYKPFYIDDKIDLTTIKELQKPIQLPADAKSAKPASN